MTLGCILTLYLPTLCKNRGSVYHSYTNLYFHNTWGNFLRENRIPKPDNLYPDYHYNTYQYMAIIENDSLQMFIHNKQIKHYSDI